MIDLEQVFQGRVLCSPVAMTDFKQIFQGHVRSSHPVVFYKKSVLLKRHKIHWKSAVPVSLV